MNSFTVTRRTVGNGPGMTVYRKTRDFRNYGAAEEYLRCRIEKLRCDGYQIEYRRTMERHREELMNDTAKTDLIWSIKAERGMRRGCGIIFTMRPATES